jgi:hypothetical protein
MTNPTPEPSRDDTDPVLARRERIRAATDLGQRVGYLAFALAVVVFVIGFVVGFTDIVVTLIVAAIIAGSIILAPAIVFAYAVKAAEQDEQGQGH